MVKGAQWLRCRVLDWRPRGRRFEPHWRLCIVSLSKNINSSFVLVQPRKTYPYITERLLMGRKESNQTKNRLMALLKKFSKKLILKKIRLWHKNMKAAANRLNLH